MESVSAESGYREDLKDGEKGHLEQGLGLGRDTCGTCHKGGREEMTSDSQERRAVLVRVEQR